MSVLSFTVPSDIRGPPQPHVDLKQYEDFWQFTCTPCKFETAVTVDIVGSELLFTMKYNNSGVKLFSDEEAFKVPGGINPADLSVEGYRTKVVKLKRPPARDEFY